MKVIIYILIFFISFSFKPNEKSTNRDKQNFMFKVFSSIATENFELFTSYAHSKSSITSYYFLSRKIDNPTIEQQNILNQFFSSSHNDYIKGKKVEFLKIQAKAKELNIIWSNTTIDSLVFKESKIDGLPFTSGTVFFKNKNYSNFYKMNFDALISINDTFHIDKVYIPYAYIGPKNRLETENLKKNYIDNCTKKAQDFIDNFHNNSIATAMFKDCTKCYCEKLYFNETEEDDGIQRIKSQKLPFHLPPNNKPKK